MSDDLTDIFAVSGSALKAQNMRMKVIAENIANANTVATTAGGNPYQRQTISFKNEFDKAVGAYKVSASKPQSDGSQFVKKFDPSNPSADSQGYVLTPNVNPLLEMMDMSDASHAYQANLNVIDSTRSMVLRTISILQ